MDHQVIRTAADMADQVKARAGRAWEVLEYFLKKKGIYHIIIEALRIFDGAWDLFCPLIDAVRVAFTYPEVYEDCPTAHFWDSDTGARLNSVILTTIHMCSEILSPIIAKKLITVDKSLTKSL